MGFHTPHPLQIRRAMAAAADRGAACPGLLFEPRGVHCGPVGCKLFYQAGSGCVAICRNCGCLETQLRVRSDDVAETAKDSGGKTTDASTLMEAVDGSGLDGAADRAIDGDGGGARFSWLIIPPGGGQLLAWGDVRHQISRHVRGGTCLVMGSMQVPGSAGRGL